jgi:type II secretory pathway component GspD/PulD (secretin)
LSSPQVMVWDGDQAEICVIEEIPYIKAYVEPEKPGDKPIPEFDWTWVGMKLDVRPRLTEDEESAHIEMGVELRSLLGYAERVYEKKYRYQTPILDTTEIRTDLRVSLGKTILIHKRGVRPWGRTVAEKDKDEPTTSLLMLIKASKAE